MSLEPQPRKRYNSREADWRKVLEGFEGNVFVINTGAPDWAEKVQPFMRALDRLQKQSARRRARRVT
jgi:hypothetical protein